MTTDPHKRLSLAAAAQKTITHLRENELLTGDHEITAALIEALADEWYTASSPTQRAAIARELRSAIKMLPGQEADADGATDKFFAGFAKAVQRTDEPLF